MKLDGVRGLVGSTFIVCLFMSRAGLAAVDEQSNPYKDNMDACISRTKESLVFSIYDDGHVSVGNTQLDISQLDWFLKSHVAKSRRRERVFICADRRVKYRAFIDFINHLNLDGFHKIGLIADNISGSPPGSPSENPSMDNPPATTPK
jgi:biopolymer transport protein ExbD